MNIFMKFDDSNRKIMIFRMLGSHSGGYEEYYLLGYNAV
jgi:hypothetical protein